MLVSDLSVPAELAHDVVIIDHALPGPDELTTVVKEVCEAAKEMPQPSDVQIAKAVDAVSGLSAFEAEQVTAMSLTADGIDIPALWERKRMSIEQTDGLTIVRGTTTFDDLRGLESVKARLRSHITAKTPLGVVVWIDEGADVFSNVESDTSGVKTDQQRGLLTKMEEHGWRGIIAVGVPGSGKSALAAAFGNEAGVPTISVDFGAMESRYVGDSEAKLRQAISVIEAVGRGHAFFVLTCNSLRGIRPQFQRRFRRGVFFFDLPTADEREAIWQLYEKKYGIVSQPRPSDEAWTGSEIRECCESAWDTGTTLLEAATYIVPIARSRASEIETMRTEAHGRFLDASHAGTYRYEPEAMKPTLRAIALPKPVVDAIVGMRES